MLCNSLLLQSRASEISKHNIASILRDKKQEDLLEQLVNGSTVMYESYDELKKAVHDVESKLEELLQRTPIDSEENTRQMLSELLEPLQTKLDSLLELLQPKPKEKEEEKSDDA